VFLIVKKMTIKVMPATPIAPPKSNRRNRPLSTRICGLQNSAKFPTASRMRSSVGPKPQNEMRNSPSACVAKYD